MTTLVERLEVWGCRLKLVDDKWEVDGIVEDLEDLLTFNDQTDRDEVALRINGATPDLFDLNFRALATRLDWRGYNSRERGWATNVKLDDVYKYTKKWDWILDQLEDEDDSESDWSHLVESDWAWFIATCPIELDRDKFGLYGRSGGWLLYTREELNLEEAEALYSVYESVPVLVDYLCRTIATNDVAYRISEAWDCQIDTVEHDMIYLYGGRRLGVDYDQA